MLIDNLKALREKAGYSAKEFAKELGIGYNAYLSYENYNAWPTQENLLKIAQKLNVSTDELIGIPKPKINDCPFCGSDNVRVMEVYTGEFNDEGHQVTCDGCDACGGVEKTERDAINKWNSVYRKE